MSYDILMFVASGVTTSIPEILDCTFFEKAYQILVQFIKAILNRVKKLIFKYLSFFLISSYMVYDIFIAKLK